MIFNSAKWKEQSEYNQKTSSQLKALDKSLQNSFGNVKSDVEHIKQWVVYLHKSQERFSNSLNHIDNRISTLLTKNEIRGFVDEYYQNLTISKNNMSNVKREILMVKEDISFMKGNMLAIRGAVSSVKGEISGEISSLRNTTKDIFERLESLSRREPSLRNELKDELRHELDVFRRDIKSEVCQKIEENSTPSLPPTIFQRLDDLNRRMDEINLTKSSIQNSQVEVNSPQNITSTRSSLKEKIFKKVTRHSKDYVKSMLISLIKKYDKISGLNLREIVVEEQGIVSKSSFYRLLTEIEEEEGIHVLHEGKEKHYFWTLNVSPESR
jgi:archaellum component FlaC